MDGECRTERAPLDLRREFAGGRLEAQGLARTFELVVPVVRRTLFTKISSTAESGMSGWNQTGRVAQGA